jgi:C_GCAxxG_C_C family probable redox protein
LDKSQHALERFRSGRNCSQSVLGAFAADLGLDMDVADRVACAFGGGVGGTGGVCGAVTGAVMVIGLSVCHAGQNNPARAHADVLVRSFLQEFKTRHQGTDCRELLGCDIGTPEGAAQAQSRDLFNTRCPLYVETAVEILEEIL